jgi:ELWxxDGT repeat protein
MRVSWSCCAQLDGCDRVDRALGQRRGAGVAHASSTSAASITADLADPRELTPLGDRLLFVAYHPSISQALFSVSKTTGAVERLGAVSPGFRGAFPSGLVRFNDSVYFAMNDGLSGFELWATDGTAAGTRQVLDIEPGADDSTPPE